MRVNAVSQLLRNGMILILFTGFLASRVSAADKIDFNRDVRPILSDACFKCHGPDEKQRKAKLRLDVPEVARRVIVAGKPSESKLIARITSDDPDSLMPPPRSKKVLKPQQKEVLRKWIAQGANFSVHWAFVAPVRPPLPKTANDPWV